MKWVTWEQVGVDRMACAWLITKYLDQEAEFLFVPAGQKPLPEGAEPFDIPGVRLSHHRGHCTFYTMLREYDLHDPILHRIARVVDEADTVQEVSLEPAAAGLDLRSRWTFRRPAVSGGRRSAGSRISSGPDRWGRVISVVGPESSSARICWTSSTAGSP